MNHAHNAPGAALRRPAPGFVRATAAAAVALLIAAGTFVSALPAHADETPAAQAASQSAETAAAPGGDTSPEEPAASAASAEPAETETEIASETDEAAVAGGSETDEPALAEQAAPGAAAEAALETAKAEPEAAEAEPEAASFAPPVQPAGLIGLAPVAVDDHFEVLQDTTLVTTAPSILGNDSDKEGDFYRYEATDPATGVLQWTGSEAFQYTPAAGFTGTVTFAYRISDYDGNLSEWATVHIDVLPAGSDVDLPPVPAMDTYLYAPGTPLYIAAPGLFANDHLDGDVTTVYIEFPLAGPDIQFIGDGGFLFTPAGSGPDTYSFTYVVCTTAGCGSGFVWLYPTAEGFDPDGPAIVPEAPVAAPDYYGVVKDTVLSVPAAQGVLANDTDIEAGDALEAIVDDSALQGSLAWSTDGSFTYTPPVGFAGTDTFTYYVNDAHALTSAEVTVELQVGDGGVSRPPVAMPDHYVVEKDRVLIVPAPAPLLNDIDPDGDAISFAGTSGTPAGKWNVYATGWLRYVPVPGFTGTDTAMYRVQDATGRYSAWTTVTFEVVAGDGENSAPQAAADVVTAPTGQTIHIDAPGVLGNDTDADGDALAVVENPVANHGEIAMNADGSYTYTSDAGYVGNDSIGYAVTDGTATAYATLELLVYAPGEEPTWALGDAYTTMSDTLLEVGAPGVLENDIVPPGVTPVLGYIIQEPEHGTLTANEDGSFTYLPAAGFVGTDTFRYTMFAGEIAQYPTVTISVVAPEESPAGPADPTGPVEGSPTGPDVPGLPADDDPLVPADDAGPAAAATGSAAALAVTGTDPAGALLGATLLALAGAVAMVIARVRRRAEH